jgi:hypothetical protein
MRNLFILLISLLSTIHLGAKDVYMFSYFIGNGEDGLHLAYSYDGLKWEDVSDLVSFPQGTRHGTAFKITTKEFETIKTALEK